MTSSNCTASSALAATPAGAKLAKDVDVNETSHSLRMSSPHSGSIKCFYELRRCRTATFAAQPYSGSGRMGRWHFREPDTRIASENPTADAYSLSLPAKCHLAAVFAGSDYRVWKPQ
jgi:hypothetical protein